MSGFGYFTECEELRLRIGQVVRRQGLQVGDVHRLQRPNFVRGPTEYQVALVRDGKVCRMLSGTEGYIMDAVHAS